VNQTSEQKAELKMPIYKYFGTPAKYHGKPLFHILSNLKNFGVGRVVTRSSFEEEPEHKNKPSFYRILWVQPLMDTKSETGRVVAERVRHGVRYTEPVQLQDIAPSPDFKLISKDQEADYCKWDKIREFTPEVDYVTEPKYYTMPPLLKLLMERNLKERNEVASEDSFMLPHYKTYIKKNYELTDPGWQRWDDLKEEFQETITKCEGTASHNYADMIDEQFRVHDKISILDQLPEEPPMPSPAVGMRMYHWPDTSRRHKEEIRTSEHDTFFP